MEEGNAKELAQINANYDAKIAEIQKRERELLQTLQDENMKAGKAAILITRRKVAICSYHCRHSYRT